MIKSHKALRAKQRISQPKKDFLLLRTYDFVTANRAQRIRIFNYFSVFLQVFQVRLDRTELKVKLFSFQGTPGVLFKKKHFLYFIKTRSISFLETSPMVLISHCRGFTPGLITRHYGN